MTSDPGDYTLECRPQAAVIAGVMRLESVEAYARVLAPVRAAIGKGSDPYTIDLAGLIFLNSSGIRAVGELVLEARRVARPLILVGDGTVPWQRKTFVSFGRLYDRLEMRLEAAD